MSKMEIDKKEKHIEEESAGRDKASESWLASQKKTTYWAYKTHWKRFAEFTGLGGDQILESRKNDKDFYWESRVLEFKAWLMREPWQLSSNSATSAAQAIRGFFAYYRMPLVFQRKETRKIGEHTRKTEDYRFSLADLKKMDEVADLQERYVLRVGKSFGLRAGDFLRLSRGDVEPYIENEPPASIGSYHTQKEGVVAWPFLDSDALPIVRVMVEKMTREGKTKQTDRLLPFKRELELSRALKRIALKAGVNPGNKTIRFHNLRKFLCDHLSSHMSESKWKQVVGKKISEGAYISPDELRKDYRRAMVETCFETFSAVEDRLKSLEAFKESLTPEQREAAKRAGYQFRKRPGKAEPDDEKPDDCADGEHCQKIVSESELGDFLAESWKVVATLPSGKIVIAR
jgi:integrase